MGDNVDGLPVYGDRTRTYASIDAGCSPIFNGFFEGYKTLVLKSQVWQNFSDNSATYQVKNTYFTARPRLSEDNFGSWHDSLLL